MRWLWAAYEMGGFRDVMDSDLPQGAFADRMTEIIASASYDWVLEARGKEGLRPVGLVLGFVVGRGVEPGIEWLPWATSRNQLEAAAVFLSEISKEHKIMVFAGKNADAFWGLFVQYRMIRRVGKVINYFARGEHATLYHTAGTI